jgi:ABC-type lipoprotein release transport system permease subunit
VYKYFIAIRYLRSRFITWLGIAGVTIGVMALVIVTSVMGGFQQELHERIRGTMGHINIEPQTFFGISNTDEIEDIVSEIDYVEGTSPYVESIALFTGNTLDWGKIKGIDPDKETSIGNLHKYVLTDEESEAFGKYDRVEKDLAALKRDTEKFAWVIDHLKKDRSDDEVAAIVKIAGKMYNHAADTGDAKKITELDLPPNGLEALIYYGASVMLIKEFEKKLVEYKKIKDAAKKREPLKPEYIQTLFTTKRKHRYDVVTLDDYSTIRGELISEDSSEVVIRPVPEGDSLDNSSTGAITIPASKVLDVERKVSPIIVGIQWYKLYNRKIHDTISIFTVRPDKLRHPFNRDFEIVGTFKTGMFDTDFRYVYTDTKSLQDFLQLGGRISGITVKLDDWRRVDEAKKDIEAAIKQKTGKSAGEQGLRVFTWKQKQKTLLAAVKMEKWLLYFILLFMIIIAGFMNLCILTMMVVPRTSAS